MRPLLKIVLLLGVMVPTSACTSTCRSALTLRTQTVNPNAPLAFSTTALSERRWNFNDGQGPFGLKKNAEIWNGRVAQMAFVFIFLQELISGKGVIQGIAEGDPINLATAGLFALTMAGLTGFLALKGAEDYVDDI